MPAGGRDPIPILFDTDIGSDIDDALALVYLLRQRRCELVGITTVTGEPERRAMLADAICRAEGRDDVPVHSGSPKPLFRSQAQPEATQAEVLPRWPHRDDFPPCTAVPYLRDEIRNRPREIVLVAVGALTNLGLLFALDPELPSLLRALVMMCGSFTPAMHAQRPTEWNASGDAHATTIVYRAEPPVHRSIGLDVTMQCSLPAQTCRDRFRGGGLDIVMDMAEVWFREEDAIRFHDPLAAAAVFDASALDFVRGEVFVSLGPGELAGQTRFEPRPEGRHEIAFRVRPDAFFDHLFRTLEG